MGMIVSPQSRSARRSRGTSVLLVFSIATGVMAFSADWFESMREPSAQPIALSASSPAPAASATANLDRAAWMELNEGQRAMLLPLEATWPGLDAANRQRWLAVAAQLLRLSPEARGRAQMRMVEWARLPPKMRAHARLQYVYAKQVPASKRNDLWNQYRLSPLPSVAAAKSQTGASMVGPALAQVKPGATTVPITQLLKPTSFSLQRATTTQRQQC